MKYLQLPTQAIKIARLLVKTAGSQHVHLLDVVRVSGGSEDNSRYNFPFGILFKMLQNSKTILPPHFQVREYERWKAKLLSV